MNLWKNRVSVHTALLWLFCICCLETAATCPTVYLGNWVNITTVNRQPGSYMPQKRSLMRIAGKFQLPAFGLNEGSPTSNQRVYVVKKALGGASFALMSQQPHVANDVTEDMDFMAIESTVFAFGVTNRAAIVQDTLSTLSVNSTEDLVIAGVNASNSYIGSIVRKSDTGQTQFLWWTSNSLPSSQFVYTAQFNFGGWTGPFTKEIGPSHIAEMHAAWLEPLKVVFIASQYNSGTATPYYNTIMGIIDIETWPYTYTSGIFAKNYVPADVFVHPVTSDVHAIARSAANNDIKYGHRLSSTGQWVIDEVGSTGANQLLPGRFRVRFASYNDTLALYVGSNNGLKVVTWKLGDIAGQALNFNNPCVAELDTPAAHFANPGAIYTENIQKQTEPVQSLDVALVGMPPDYDNHVIYRTVAVNWAVPRPTTVQTTAPPATTGPAATTSTTAATSTSVEISPVSFAETTSTSSSSVTTSTSSSEQTTSTSMSSETESGATSTSADAVVDTSKQADATATGESLELALILGAGGGALLLLLVCIVAALFVLSRKRRSHHQEADSASRVNSRQSYGQSRRGASRGASRALTRHQSRQNAASANVQYALAPAFAPTRSRSGSRSSRATGISGVYVNSPFASTFGDHELQKFTNNPVSAQYSAIPAEGTYHDIPADKHVA